MSEESIFRFKQFDVLQSHAMMKVNTDSIMLGAWVDLAKATNVLDIGTGTGILSLMLAQKANREVSIDGVEIDQNACLDAAINFDQFTKPTQLKLYQQSIQEFSEEHADRRYDLIITNPPFFSGGTLSYNENRNKVRQTTKLSHNELLKIVSSFLSEAGRFALILPIIEGLRFIEMAEMYQLFLQEKCSVSSAPEGRVQRLIMVFTKHNCPALKETKLTIYDKDGNYSKEYVRLTKAFYAHDLSVSIS